MRYAFTRQLIAPILAILLLSATSHGTSQETRAMTMAEQLQAAGLRQAALAAGEAKPEDWRKLDETYAALVAQNPRDLAARNAHAEFLWEIGEQSRAMTEWETAAQIDPKNALVLEHLGSGALALGEVRKSAAYYRRAVACDPANADRHFALANVSFLFRHELLDAEHADEGSLLTRALFHFAEAARLAPTSANYARAYAETFYSVPNPDWAAALNAWQIVQRLSPQPDFALLHQARVHLKMGHLDTAQQCLSQVQSPDYQTLKSRLEAQLKPPVDSAKRDR